MMRLSTMGRVRPRDEAEQHRCALEGTRSMVCVLECVCHSAFQSPSAQPTVFQSSRSKHSYCFRVTDKTDFKIQLS